jgi:hypothetical protein
MKRFILVSALALLAGCQPYAEVRNYPVIPDELKDCKFFYLVDKNGSAITVARCPNSSTTVQMNNKARTKSVIIDGKEYTEK